MVHLPPLPGSPRWAGSMATVLQRARSDARTLDEGEVDAVLVENYGDAPFAELVGPDAVAGLTAAVMEVRQVTSRPIGVNVLRNDAVAALAVAAATGASFIRVNIHTGGMYTDQGWIEGRAAETLRLRQRWAPDVAILADVMVKHASPPPGLDLRRAAADAWDRGLADALVVSGTATGVPTAVGDVGVVREAVPAAVVLVGSGVTTESVRSALKAGHGVIVGSALEEGGKAGRPVDPERVRRLMAAARG
jgi:membrane complex biogenesis BtpA family protein